MMVAEEFHDKQTMQMIREKREKGRWFEPEWSTFMLVVPYISTKDQVLSSW